MSHYRVTLREVDTAGKAPFDSHFLSTVRQLCLYKPERCAFMGTAVATRKKRQGERRICYAEVVAQIAKVRNGAKAGLGAAMVATLINDLIRDTLPEGAALDVVAMPVAGDSVPVRSRRDEELDFSIAAATLITTAERVMADGRLDPPEAGELEATVAGITHISRRLLTAVRSEAGR